MSYVSFRAMLRASAALVPCFGATASLAQTAPAPAGSRIDIPQIEIVAPAPGSDIQETTAGPVRGYRALSSRSATKTDTPVEQIPQSLQIIPRKLIDDQGATTQSEVLRNVSGVQPLNPVSGGQINPTARGFAAERFVDGLPNYYDAGGRDLLANVERIEVLKGPASILYQGGPNPIGGVINVVSKLPTHERFAELGLSAGSYGFWSPYFDVNRPLNAAGTVLFRMTGQYENSNGDNNIVNRRSFSLNPTLMFTNNDTTSLILQGNISQRYQKDYSALPAMGTLDTSGYRIDRRLFPASHGVPEVDSRIASFSARFDHRFNEVWSTFTTARYSVSRFREPAQSILSNTPAFAPSTFGVFNATLNEDNTEVSFNTNAVAKFDTGPAKNRVLFGFDYNRVTDNGTLNADFAGLVDFANPVFPAFVTPATGPFTTFTDIRNVYQQAGMTAQWQSTLWERLHLLAALRVANVDIRSRELTTVSSFHTSETKVLPRIGAAFDLMPGLTPFVSYSEGLRAVPFFNGPSAPKPEHSRQVEAGVKVNFGGGLSGTLAGFEITRTNVATTPVGGFVQVQTGEQRSYGFEVDLVWQPMPGLSVLGSYAHIEPSVTSDGNPALVGKQLTAVPRDSARLWANYSFPEGPFTGLSVGAGAYAASAQTVELGSPWRTPGYATFDARIAYRYQDWTIALVGKNLADKQYFVPYPYFSGRVAPGDGRTAYLSISKRF